MRLSSELDKIIRQYIKDDSAYEVIHNMLVDEPTSINSHANYLKQFHRVATARYDSLEQMFEAYLKVGCTLLDIDVGSVNKVEQNTYYIQARFPHDHYTTEGIPLNQVVCQHVVTQKQTFKFHDSKLLDPSIAHYTSESDVNSYIGSPIFVNDDLWGLICFYGKEARLNPFSEAEVEFVELMAMGISSAINTNFTRQQKQMAEQRYQLIFENIDIPVLIYDVDTYEIFDVNPSATDFYGYTREEFLELTMLDINMMPQADIETRLLHSQEAGLPYTRFPHRLKLGDIREIEDYSNEMVIEDRRLRFSLIYDYSERHAAEEALQHSEANLRAIFDNASQLMFLVDETSNIIAMNRAASKMMEAISGTPFGKNDTTLHNYHPKSDRYLVSDYINRALNGHTTIHDTLIKLDNNQAIYIHYRYVPVKTPDDEIIGVCVTGQDVTDLKLSEEKLAYERNILRTLIDNLPDAIYIKDSNARLLTANKRYLDITKADSMEEVLGKSDPEIFGEYGEAYFQDDIHVLRNGVILNKDEPVILPDNTEGIFETTKVPLRDEDGHIMGLVGAGRDITKQREIEQGLRDNEEKFTQLITHIPEAFSIFDIASQKIIYASDNYETMFGISVEAREQDVNRLIEQIHPDDRSLVIEGLQHQSNGQSATFEARFINDETVGHRWVSVRIYPISNEDGEVYRVAGVASDITQQKDAQANMLEMRAQRERINILSNFFRDASHEFRTPLSVINTSLYVIDKTDDPDKQHMHVGLIQDQVRGISELVEMLVLMSRLDSGAEITFMPINVNVVTKQFNQIFQDVYTERTQDLKMKLDRSLPPILGNRIYLMQAIRNLIDNAVRYSEPNSPVYLRSYHNDRHVVIEVEDHGIGISEAELPQIFQRFYRGDEAHSTRGFGLGLPIAQSIAFRHGGEIRVETELGHGSKFQFLLPAIRARRD